MKKIVYLFLLLIFCPLISLASSLQSSVTQYGITWTFNTDYTVGQFATGDYYVVDPGSGVTITDVSNTHHSGTDLSTVDYDGTTLNVPAWSCTDIYPDHGWDSRMGGYNSSNNINKNLPYTLTAGNSLTTVESWLSSDPDRPYHPTRIRPSLKVFAILTCVSSDVGSTAFRPSYADGQNTIYYTSQLQSGKYPDLTTISGTPSLATVESYIQHPWIDLSYEFGSEYWKPNENYGITTATDSCTYNGHIVNRYNQAMLRLFIDDGDRAQLLYYLVQIGIDYYGLYLNGASWPSNGGHQNGMKLAILFTGTLLNNSSMLAIGELPITNPSCSGIYINDAYFHDDGSTFYVTQADVDRTHVTCHTYDDTPVGYSAGDIDMPEWGVKHSVDPQCDDKAIGNDGNEAYRMTFGDTEKGQVLIAEIMNLQSTWNHEALFDYMDRYDDLGLQSTGYFIQFVQDMWDEYRDACDDGACLPAGSSIKKGLSGSENAWRFNGKKWTLE